MEKKNHFLAGIETENECTKPITEILQQGTKSKVERSTEILC